MVERRKLFSSNSAPVRRKLFSLTDGATIKTLKCADCGFEIESKATTTNITCPKCGGRHFNVIKKSEDPTVGQGTARLSLFSDRSQEEEAFQKSFSEPTNDFELKLKKYSGKTILTESCEKIFGVSADEMIEKRFASIDGENMEIASDAYLKSKLFSKLIVSVTKIMDLDPEITCGSNPMEDKLRAIKKLEMTGSLCPKSIIMIKKAHGVGPEPISDSHANSWAEDSGILGDLKAEFGGSSLEYPSFKRTIEDRYPDAPEGILDLLKNRGIIRISGDRVNVL